MARPRNSLDNGDLNLSLAYLQETIVLFSDFARAHHKIAWLFRLRNQPNEAIESIEHAIELTSNLDKRILFRGA